MRQNKSKTVNAVLHENCTSITVLFHAVQQIWTLDTYVTMTWRVKQLVIYAKQATSWQLIQLHTCNTCNRQFHIGPYMGP